MQYTALPNLLSCFARLGLCALLLAARGDSQHKAVPLPTASTRWKSTMLGYRGVGGDIDGVRNPDLWARTGETVRITLVNGELMVHDIALEKHNVKSAQILDKGATASITFKANESDTYFCSLPGHRAAGMEGRLDVSDEPPPTVGGRGAGGKRPAAQSGFRDRTLDNWTATGDAFAGRARATLPRRHRRPARRRPRRAVLGQQRRAAAARGRARSRRRRSR